MTEQGNGNGNNSKNVGAKQKKPTSIYRKIRRKFAQTRLRAPLVWWRHRGLNPTDMFFAAYPKSGTTWARFVLFEMLSGEPAFSGASFVEIAHSVLYGSPPELTGSPAISAFSRAVIYAISGLLLHVAIGIGLVVLAPFVWMGLKLGTRIHTGLTQQQMKRVVGGLLVFTGMSLLWRLVLQLFAA